ncbi:DNA repair protein RadC [Opitutaceae bacterium]|nr:DNA repair protein RadC [bacterium]MDB4384723.1 DNA repair protein RadC [Opitutaceae bacterium]
MTDSDSDAFTRPNRLAVMATGERPQERLQRHGAAALSDSELLAMLLRSGTRGQDVLTLAEELISKAGSLADLIKWTRRDFERHKGIGRIKALQLVTVMEISRRVMQHNQNEDPKLDEPATIAEYCRPECLGLGVEKFWVLCLNRRNRLIRRIEVTSGTAGSTLVHPREVFREAIKEAASAVVCVHNHPSGDPAPSAADIRVTRTLREAARTVDIALLDHVIVGEARHDPTGLGYYSFRDAGVL